MFIFALRKKFFINFIFLLVFSFCFLSPSLAKDLYLPPRICASSAILVDKKTGEILFEKESHLKRPIASTTKIMTAIIVLEESPSLKKKVEISNQASEAGEAEMYLSPGEIISIENLLYGLLLRSANDAAIALAEATCGSVEKFVQKMNEKAKEINANDTHFSNPHGLKNSSHYSTAYDLSLITRYALKNKKFSQFVSTKVRVVPWPGNSYPRVLENHNQLVHKYPFITGVKTGYTYEAGYCLVASAKKDNVELISVILNSPSSSSCYEDTLKLLNYGFTAFTFLKVISKKVTYARVKVPEWESKLNLISLKDVTLRVKRGEELERVISAINPTNLPIKKGQKFGEIKIIKKGKLVAQSNLVSSRNIPKPTIFQKIKIIWRNTLSRLRKK